MKAITPELVHAPIGLVDPDPNNPASRSIPDPDLVESIRANGILQPPEGFQNGDRWELVFGARRLAAAKKAGLETFPIITVAKPEDAHRIVVSFTENNQRRAMDPIVEAEQLFTLRERLGSAELVASTVGRSAAWVSRRIGLLDLSGKWRTAWTDQLEAIKDWPAGMLELVATLPDDQQDKLLEKELDTITTREELQTFIAEHLMALQHAPWDLGDETLGGADGSDDGAAPADRACTTCPENSGNTGGLFGVVPDDMAQTTCRNAECFRAKWCSWLLRKREEHREQLEAPVLLVLSKSKKEASESKDYKPRDWWLSQDLGRQLLTEWERLPKNKSGVPAMLVNGSKAGTIAYIAPPPAAESTQGNPKTVAEKRAELDQKRALWEMKTLHEKFEAAVADWDDKNPKDSEHDLLPLLVRFGVPIQHIDKKPRKLSPAGLEWRALKGLHETAARHLTYQIAAGRTNKDARKRLSWIGAVLVLLPDADDVRKEAEEKFPEPASWSK